jgi:hypothetical protein
MKIVVKTVPRIIIGVAIKIIIFPHDSQQTGFPLLEHIFLTNHKQHCFPLLTKLLFPSITTLLSGLISDIFFAKHILFS